MSKKVCSDYMGGPQQRSDRSRTTAAKLKIIGNAMILGQIELLAEVMTLADKSEVGAANVSQFVHSA